MYIPKHFHINDKETIYNIIEEFGFAIVISEGEHTPIATHLPLLLSKDRTYLHGHFARANPHWKDLANKRILVIFQGPHSYISPSWYETDRAVPTWNYVAVHVYGELEYIGDKELSQSLKDLVSKYEKPNSPYQLNDVDTEFIEGLSRGVVGFRIKIDSMEAKAKLSQNHSTERLTRVIAELEKKSSENEKQIAKWMKIYNKLG